MKARQWDLIAGLDLGQARDYSGLVVVERLAVQPQEPYQRLGEERHVPHIERFALGTPYPAIVERVTELIQARPDTSNAWSSGPGISASV